MTKLHPKTLKAEAAQRLRPIAGETRRLTLIYLGAAALVSLLGEALSLLLQYWISDTGGLSGLGTRSILQTLQSVFPYVTVFLSPVWAAGFTRIVLLWADGKRAEDRELLSGFRRFSAVLSYELIWGLLVFGLFLFSTNVASALYMLLPQSEELVMFLSQAAADGVTDLSGLPVEEYLRISLPLALISLGICAVMVAYMSYNLRLSRYLIMDEPGMSGFAAMKASLRAMRGHKLAFLKLELSFWWFYVLMIGAVLICGLGMHFLLLHLGFDAVVAYFLIYAVCVVVANGFYLWKLPHIDTTLALAYRRIVAPSE